MTEDARKVFDKRYVNDIGKAKIKPIHSYGMAARIKKSVENGIAVSEKKAGADGVKNFWNTCSAHRTIWRKTVCMNCTADM